MAEWLKDIPHTPGLEPGWRKRKANAELHVPRLGDLLVFFFSLVGKEKNLLIRTNICAEH